MDLWEAVNVRKMFDQLSPEDKAGFIKPYDEKYPGKSPGQILIIVLLTGLDHLLAERIKLLYFKLGVHSKLLHTGRERPRKT